MKNTPQDGLHIDRQNVPYNGALIIGSIRYSQPVDLSDALRFGGRKYIPVDFVDMSYATNEDGSLTFRLKDESAGFGSRSAGEPIRKKLMNLAGMAPREKIRLDFSDVPLVSSSFADEVFGKLFIELGPITFAQRFTFENIDDLVAQLIDKAVSQRFRDA